MPSDRDLANLLQDKATAETVKDELVDLKDNRAYQLVLARLEQLHSRDLRLLVRGEATQSLERLQGRVEAMEEAINMVPELLRQIEETDYERVKELSHG